MFKYCVNLLKIIKNSNKTVAFGHLRRNTLVSRSTNNYKLCSVILVNKYRSQHNVLKAILALNVLGWLGFEDDDEEKDSELIMTLKRSILAQQREQFEKAEQLLHLALRLSQQIQSEQGVVYCYDLMANLAMERLELDKAEKLFVSVLQMLLSSGLKQDDLKVIHVSLKLARIYHLKAEEDKAEMGYKWCLENIEKQKLDSFDSKGLYGVIQDWYAQFLLDRGDVETSLKHLKGAYTVSKEIKGKISEQSMLLLNDLGITSWRAGDLDGAMNFLSEAVDVSKALDDKTHVGVVYANIGLIYLQKGLKSEAEKYCKNAWQLGKRFDNTESIEQANYCFEQIKLNL